MQALHNVSLDLTIIHLPDVFFDQHQPYLGPNPDQLSLAILGTPVRQRFHIIVVLLSLLMQRRHEAPNVSGFGLAVRVFWDGFGFCQCIEVGGRRVMLLVKLKEGFVGDADLDTRLCTS